MDDESFVACSDRCPALTGEPYGSVRYCPMAENQRHRDCPANVGSQRAAGKGAARRWEAYDWRVGRWVSIAGFGKTDIPPHPDQTDCCTNFQCCVATAKRS